MADYQFCEEKCDDSVDNTLHGGGGKLSDKVAVMVKGEVKAVGTVSELLQRTGKQNLEEAFVSIVGVE